MNYTLGRDFNGIFEFKFYNYSFEGDRFYRSQPLILPGLFYDLDNVIFSPFSKLIDKREFLRVAEII